MLRKTERCSRSVQWRLEKIGCRRLRVRYGEQTVHETKWNADAFETPTLLDDEVSTLNPDSVPISICHQLPPLSYNPGHFGRSGTQTPSKLRLYWMMKWVP